MEQCTLASKGDPLKVNSLGNGCLGRRVNVGLRLDTGGGGLRSKSARLERWGDDGKTLDTPPPLPANLSLRGEVGSETSRWRGDSSAMRRMLAGGVTERSSEVYE